METMYFLLAMLAGVLIRFLYKWSYAIKAKREFDWKLPLITAVLSIVTNIFLILVRADLEAFLPMTYLTAGFYGCFGDSIFRMVGKYIKPNLKK